LTGGDSLLLINHLAKKKLHQYRNKNNYFSVFTGYGEYYAAGPAEDDMAYHIMAHYPFSVHYPLTLIDQFFFLSTEWAFYIIVFAYFQFYLPNLNRNQRAIDLRTK